MWNSAYASINRGPAHANLKRVLAACPLRARSGPSRMIVLGDIGSADSLAGGVIGYGTNLIDAYRQAAVYAGPAP